MQFLRKHLNSKHWKLKTYYSASKTKTRIKNAPKTCIKNPQFNLFYQYMFFKLVKHKKEIGITFLASCDFPTRYVNGCP